MNTLTDADWPGFSPREVVKWAPFREKWREDLAGMDLALDAPPLMDKAPNYWTVSELQYLRKRVSNGDSLRTIGAALGRSYHAAYYQAKRMGLLEKAGQ